MNFHKVISNNSSTLLKLRNYNVLYGGHEISLAWLKGAWLVDPSLSKSIDDALG